MIRDSNRCAGSEVHIVRLVCTRFELIIEGKNLTRSIFAGSRKHASNCGAWDISSIE
jgi:hypothetical protein